MLSKLLSRVLMVIVLMQFKQNLGASTLEPIQTAASADNVIKPSNEPLPTDVIPIRHSRSRVHRHLHALTGVGVTSTNNTEPFVLLGTSINNAQLPFNYANDFQRVSLPRTAYTFENVQLTSNFTPTTTSTMSAGESAMHKIRKLHKKQLMENMRNTVHHRSLIQAAQINERQTSKTSEKLITGPNAEADNNLMYLSDQSYNGHTNNTPNIKFDETTTKPKNNAITKLYPVNESAKEIKSRQKITDEDQQSISASDSNDPNESSSGGMEEEEEEVEENRNNNNINIDRNLSSLEQQNDTESEISFEYIADRMAYSSPQTIGGEGQSHVEKQLLNKEDLTLDFMWNENDTYAPNRIASTSLGEEITAERQLQSQQQQQQQQRREKEQQSSLSAFLLADNNLKGISFVDKADEATVTTDFTMIDNNHENGFPLESDDTMVSVAGEDEELMESNQLLEGVIDAANVDEIYDWDEISRNNRRNLMRGRDVVTKFLQIVETQHSLGSNCEAGTSLNLGEGVVDRYAQDRFRVEAEVAVNRANMLTR